MKDDVSTQQEDKKYKYSNEGEPEYASREEVAEAFEDAYKNIKHLHKRLLYFALGKIRLYFNANTFRNTDAEDVVQIVSASILSLRRKWYRDKIPDFHKFVRLTILSYIRNERKRKDKFETGELFDDDNNLTADNINEIIKEYAREDAEQKYFREDVEILIQRCIDELDDDVFAVFVLEERCNGLESNIEIAEKLGIEVREVENARKRIKNKFGKLLYKK